MTGYAEAAPLYRETGWAGVLPLPPGAKYPPPTGATGNGAGDPDDAQIARWAAELPAGNLALRLPDNVIGIDVDAYGDKPGAATLAALEARLGPLPDTPISSSKPPPSGIRFYRVPAGRKWRSPGQGIDIIHRGHRYAVAWPSIHPSGAAYQWSPYAIPRPEMLPELPPAWVAELDDGELPIYVEGDLDDEHAGAWLTEVAPAGTCRIMAESLGRHAANVATGGGRHDAMRDGVLALVTLASNGHRGGKDALAELRRVFQDSTTDRDTWGEFDRALTGALRKSGASMLCAAPPCGCDEPRDAPERVAEGFSELYLVRSGLGALPRGEPLIERVLDRHALFVIAGRDQSHKSFLALDWLACLATGKPWLGYPVERTKVLYVVGEGAWGLDARVSAWEMAWGHRVEDAWLHVRRAPVNLYSKGPAFADLLARVRVERYGVVVFDTLQRMSSGADLNSAKDAGVVIDAVDQVRQATPGGAVGYVAHTGKAAGADTRGSSVLEDDADIVWRLERDDDGTTAELHKRKDGPDGLRIPLRAQPVPGTSSLVLTLTSAAGGLPSDVQPKQALPILRELSRSAAEGGYSLSAIAEAVGLRGKGGIGKPVSWLADRGLIRRVGDTPRSPYEITDAGRDRLIEAGVS